MTTSKRLNWPCMAGEPIVAWIRVGKEQYPYTAAMLKRRAERLAALAALENESKKAA